MNGVVSLRHMGTSLGLADSSGRAVFLLFIRYVGSVYFQRELEIWKNGSRAALGGSLKKDVCGNNSEVSRLEVLYSSPPRTPPPPPLAPPVDKTASFASSLLPLPLLTTSYHSRLYSVRPSVFIFTFLIPGCSSPFNCSLSVAPKIKIQVVYQSLKALCVQACQNPWPPPTHPVLSKNIRSHTGLWLPRKEQSSSLLTLPLLTLRPGLLG